MAFNIVLVDDHKLVRDGVRTILERGSEFRVVGEAENGHDRRQFHLDVFVIKHRFKLRNVGFPRADKAKSLYCMFPGVWIFVL